MIRSLLTFFKVYHISYTIAYIWRKLSNGRSTNRVLIVKPDGIGDYLLLRNFIEDLVNSNKFKNCKFDLLYNKALSSLPYELDQEIFSNFIPIDKVRLKFSSSYCYYFASKLIRKKYKSCIYACHSREYEFDRLICNFSIADELIASNGDLTNITLAHKNEMDPKYDFLAKSLTRDTSEFERNRYFFSQIIDGSVTRKLHIAITPKANFKRTIVVFPGAGVKKRQWSPKNFGTILKWLHKHYDCKIIICGGHNDIQLASQICNYAELDKTETILSGKLSFHEFIEVLGSSALLLSNETSAVHAAAATNTRTVCISNGNHFGRFNPYDENYYPIKTIYPDEKFYLPEYKKKLIHQCAQESDWDINSISVQTIKKALVRQLNLTPIKRKEKTSDLLKISIIIPSFNQGDYIEETIVSIISQNYKNLELIIIDGNSTDQTLSIIEKYKKHIHYWVSEPDKGQTEAINKGLSICTGDVVNWINSDDLLAKGALQKINQAFKQHPKKNCIIGNYVEFSVNHEVVISEKVTNKLLYEMLKHPIIKQPSTFYRKSAFETIGFLNETLNYTMDLDFWFRYLWFYGSSRCFDTDFNIAKFRIHADSKTVSLPEQFIKEKGEILLEYKKKAIKCMDSGVKQRIELTVSLYYLAKASSFFEMKQYSKSNLFLKKIKSNQLNKQDKRVYNIIKVKLILFNFYSTVRLNKSI